MYTGMKWQDGANSKFLTLYNLPKLKREHTKDQADQERETNFNIH